MLEREVSVYYLDTVLGDKSRDSYGLFLRLFRHDYDHIFRYDECNLNYPLSSDKVDVLASNLEGFILYLRSRRTADII